MWLRRRQIGAESRSLGPSLKEVAHNHSLQLGLADLAGATLLLAALDFSKYFHQLFFAAAEVWKMGALLPVVHGSGGGWFGRHAIRTRVRYVDGGAPVHEDRTALRK